MTTIELRELLAKATDAPLPSAMEAARKDIVEALPSLLDRVEALEAALEPFAHVGTLIDGPFGPALFMGTDQAFVSGCAWKENGETRFLTWDNFRAARTALEGRG